MLIHSREITVPFIRTIFSHSELELTKRSQVSVSPRIGEVEIFLKKSRCSGLDAMTASLMKEVGNRGRLIERAQYILLL